MFNLQYLEQKIKNIEDSLSQRDKNLYTYIKRAIKESHPVEKQSEVMHGISVALCVDTKDPLGLGRVKFYSPALHDINTPIKSLPYARPIANLGGFDDSGGFWVPPSGSAIIIVFENGDRDSAFYLGTTWTGYRGEPPAFNWNYPVQEFFKYYSDRGLGYLVGATDGSQTKPPWNTEAYNIPDFDDINTFEADPNAKKKITAPFIKGFKTEGKLRLKMVDGQKDCNYRGKRLELASSSALILMKDDMYHSAKSYGNPVCCGGSAGGSSIDCVDSNGNPIENTTCGEQNIIGGEDCSNPLFKREEECAFLTGVHTNMNNAVNLPQTGMQLITASGQSFIMDDSVNQPQGSTNWERGIEPFDYGCDNIFKGKMELLSSTGHSIKLSDDEEEPELRSSNNGIFLRSATGNSVSLNDHTVGQDEAGDQRGVKIESTSTHLLEMNDGGNQQSSGVRTNESEPTPAANNAYVLLRSGYGLQLLMSDVNSQQETTEQYIELMAPFKTNQEYGPSILRFQEAPAGEPGLVYLRASGNFVANSVSSWIEMIGDENVSYPNIKFTKVAGSAVVQADQMIFDYADIIASYSNEFTLLLSHKDCYDPVTEEHGPCLFSVATSKALITCPLTGYTHLTPDSFSTYVYASCNNT